MERGKACTGKNSCTLRILVFRDFEHMLGYILHPAQIMPP